MLMKYSITPEEKERLQLERKMLEKRMRETLERWRDMITPCNIQLYGVIIDGADVALKKEIEEVLK